MSQDNSQGQQPNYRQRAALEEMMTSPPFHQVMGYKLGEFDPDEGTLEVIQPYHEGVRRMAGSDQIHGGVIASLIDVAGTFAVVMYVNKGVPTIDFRVDYLRPAAGSDLVARARVRKAGRMVGAADIDVYDENQRLVAMGRALFATGV